MHRTTMDAPHTTGTVIHSARWYDFMTARVPFLRRLRESAVDAAAPMPGERVLDVGCGSGALAVALRPRVAAGKVAGIDASPEMIAVARKKAAKLGLDVDFQVAVVEALPFPDASFDLVTSTLMLHHLPDDVKRKALQEIRRVLAPGGRFLAVDFAAHSHSMLGHLMSLLGHAHGDGTETELRAGLNAAGFTAIEVLPTRHKRFLFLRAR